MADENAGANEGGEGNGSDGEAAGAAAAAAAGAEAGKGKGGKEGKNGSESSASDYDWRGAIAGEDKKLAKRLERFTDLPSFAKSYFEADAKLNDGKRVVIPGADDPDEVRAAWNKARGIPETHDKYEIKVKPPEGMELTDLEKERLSKITERLHKAGGVKADPEVVNLAHEIFYEERAEAEAQMEAAATIAKEKTESFLKKLWPGHEMKRNIGFADQAIQHFFGKDFAEIKDLQFADGSRLGDNVQFVQAMAKVGRMTMEDPVFLEAGRNGSDPSKTLLDQKTKILQLKYTDRKAYEEAAKEGGMLDQINEALARHEERVGASH